ncbi:MAG: hypothetical protein RML37_03660, partial [Chitinophagales bacterium]|nr:hypothetical protein [Chitinophagales bacterium]
NTALTHQIINALNRFAPAFGGRKPHHLLHPCAHPHNISHHLIRKTSFASPRIETASHSVPLYNLNILNDNTCITRNLFA